MKRVIKREDVIRLFLTYEAEKPRFKSRKREILSWCGLSDADMVDKAKGFALSRDDIPPVWIYTGCHPKDDRSPKVIRWQKENISVGDIFTNGIGRHMADDLESAEWNMKVFALQYADKYREFASFQENPAPKEKQTMLLVKKQKPGKVGRFELIDGSHRLVGMIRNGIKTVPAYVAILR